MLARDAAESELAWRLPPFEGLIAWILPDAAVRSMVSWLTSGAADTKVGWVEFATFSEGTALAPSGAGMSN
jgi:hypothetical protein